MTINKLICGFWMTTLMMGMTVRSSVAGDRAIAEKRYDEAFDEVEQENYENALRLFQESYDLNPAPKALFNIGMTQKALKQNREAFKTLRRALELKNPALDKKKQAAAEAAISELKDTIGYLKVISDQEGVEVSVDGERIGTTPFAEDILLLTGAQKVVCKKRGYEPLSLQVVIPKNGTVPLKVNLEVEKGTLSVACESGALVRINTDIAGACPLSKPLTPGTYDVSVTAPNKVPFNTKITVESGKTASLNVQLEAPALPSERLVSTTPRTEAQTSKSTPAFLISGIASTALGIAGLGVGIGFTVKSENDFQDVVDLIYQANKAKEDGDREAYDRSIAAYRSAKENWETTLNPADTAGMIAGYVAGGTLTVAGIVLLVIHAKKKREHKVGVAPRVGGMVVSF